MADPKAVLAEHGIAVPDGIDVNVVENSDNTVHITMPQAPAGDGELSDEELSNVAGGDITNNTAVCSDFDWHTLCAAPGLLIAEIADCMH